MSSHEASSNPRQLGPPGSGEERVADCEAIALDQSAEIGPEYLRPLDPRTQMSDHSLVKGAEFLRRLRKLARQNQVACYFVADKGKGSHGRLYYGGEFTTLKDRKKEIGQDLLAKMCRDLNIDPHSL